MRYRWRPEAGEATLPDDEARERGRDYLRSELAGRLPTAPSPSISCSRFRGEDDPLDDPTAVWPDERERVVAGRLEITELVDDPESDGHIDVFDPTRVVDGIELSDDPILHARARAYSVSAYRRLGVEVENPSHPTRADPRRSLTRRARSSAGRASRLHRGGRRFESGRAHRDARPRGAQRGEPQIVRWPSSLLTVTKL